MVPLTTILDSKGQLTLPSEVRIRLGLKEGSKVEFVVEADRVMIRPTQPTRSFEDYIGANPAFAKIEEIHRWVNDMRDPEWK